MISRRAFWGALFCGTITPKPELKKKAFIRIKPGGRLENVDITVPPGYDAAAIFEGDMHCYGNFTLSVVKPGEFTDKTRLQFPMESSLKKGKK